MKNTALKLLLISICLVPTSACVTKSNPAKTDVYYPGVGKATYHCPPGQRKKGNCI